MRYIIIFLTLPFLLFSNQYNIDSYELEQIHEMKDSLGAVFYKDKMHININYDGHLWTPVLFIHSEHCPLCQSKQPLEIQRK